MLRYPAGTCDETFEANEKKMPLDRDIYWVGKQWAVTGYGVQACDQKQKGKFDIEISRLWDDDLLESMLAQKWLNTADFDKALAMARARFPQPAGKAALAVVAAASRAEAVKVKEPRAAGPDPAPRPFAMGPDRAHARFLRTLRVRVNLQP
jgi:hypothetical protein